ncbi:hypothetical protein AKJ16_DCAP06103 [Drosera capensis]
MDREAIEVWVFRDYSGRYVACLHLWIGTLNGLWVFLRMRCCVGVRERRVETFAMAGALVWQLLQYTPRSAACRPQQRIKVHANKTGGSYRIEFCGKKWASTSMILVAAALLLSKVGLHHVPRSIGNGMLRVALILGETKIHALQDDSKGTMYLVVARSCLCYVDCIRGARSAQLRWCFVGWLSSALISTVVTQDSPYMGWHLARAAVYFVSHVLEDPAPESCGQGHMVFLLWCIFAAEVDFLLTSCDIWFSLISFKACSVGDVLWDPTLKDHALEVKLPIFFSPGASLISESFFSCPVMYLTWELSPQLLLCDPLFYELLNEQFFFSTHGRLSSSMDRHIEWPLGILKREETFAMAGALAWQVKWLIKRSVVDFWGNRTGMLRLSPLWPSLFSFPSPSGSFSFPGLSVVRLLQYTPRTAACRPQQRIKVHANKARGSYRIEFCGKKWASTSMILVAAALLLSKGISHVMYPGFPPFVELLLSVLALSFWGYHTVHRENELLRVALILGETKIHARPDDSKGDLIDQTENKGSVQYPDPQWSRLTSRKYCSVGHVLEDRAPESLAYYDGGQESLVFYRITLLRFSFAEVQFVEACILMEGCIRPLLYMNSVSSGEAAVFCCILFCCALMLKAVSFTHVFHD